METSTKGKKRLNTIKENFARGEAAFAKVLEAAKAGKTDEDVSLFVGIILPACLELSQMEDQIIQLQKDEIAARSAEAQTPSFGR